MRRLLAVSMLALTLSVHSTANADPVLELSVNSGFGGDPSQTLTLLSQPLGTFDWNGFAIGLGSTGSGLSLLVGTSASGPASQTLYVRTTSPQTAGPANGAGGSSGFVNTFSLRFESFSNSSTPPGSDDLIPVINEPGPPNNQFTNSGGPNGDTNTPSPSPVPEPASLLLFGSGLAATAMAARRRMQRQRA